MKRNYFLIAALVIATTLIATLVLYPDLPRSVPTHWNEPLPPSPLKYRS